MKSLGDNLYIRTLHHLPLPKGLSPQDATIIISIHNWAAVNEFRYRQITYPTGHVFLATITNYFNQAIQQKTTLKYVLFSAHDSTIMTVMNTLGTPVNTVPPYASDLNFSLFQNDKHYYIRVSYNNKLITIPACGGNTCSLEQFYSFTQQ